MVLSPPNCNNGSDLMDSYQMPSRFCLMSDLHEIFALNSFMYLPHGHLLLAAKHCGCPNIKGGNHKDTYQSLAIDP